MGIGTSSSNQSGSNFFSSNPINLQNPAYQGLANPTAQGIYGASQGNPSGVFGQNGNFLSPYQGQFGYFNNPSTNPLVAPVTGAQQDLLNQTLGISNVGEGTLNNQAAGTAWGATNFAQSNPLAQAFGTNSRMLDPNYAASLATSPQTQAAIGSAVQPMINAFNAQTVPGLQGTFTAAGQRLNSGSSGNLGGSSAFDIAGANALTGLEGQIGQVAGGIANNAYQTGLQQTANAVNQAGALSGQQIGNLINSATGAQGIVSSQLNNTINALNANALPQLTQQYGINQGLQLFQNQVNQMMTALGLGGQVSQPAIGNVAQGKGTSSGSSKGFNAGLPLIRG